MDSPYLLPVGPVALVHLTGSWSGLPGELAREQSWELLSSLPADTLCWDGPGPCPRGPAS